MIPQFYSPFDKHSFLLSFTFSGGRSLVVYLWKWRISKKENTKYFVLWNNLFQRRKKKIYINLQKKKEDRDECYKRLQKSTIKHVFYFKTFKTCHLIYCLIFSVAFSNFEHSYNLHICKTWHLIHSIDLCFVFHNFILLSSFV